MTHRHLVLRSLEDKFPIVIKFPLLQLNWEITNSEEKPILSSAHLSCACKHTECEWTYVCIFVEVGCYVRVQSWESLWTENRSSSSAFHFWPYRCGRACQTEATWTVWLWWCSTCSTYTLAYAVWHASAVHLIVLCRALCSRDSPRERRSPWPRCRRLVAALWRCWTSAVWGNTRAAWSLLPRSKCDLSTSGPLISTWSCWLPPQLSPDSWGVLRPLWIHPLKTTTILVFETFSSRLLSLHHLDTFPTSSRCLPSVSGDPTSTVSVTHFTMMLEGGWLDSHGCWGSRAEDSGCSAVVSWC